jgi:NADH-quinone oxidoreductase subunit M
MLKMGLYSIIRWQLPIAPLAAKEYMYIFISLELQELYMVPFFTPKDLKKLLLTLH